jgi:hypothetical protein
MLDNSEKGRLIEKVFIVALKQIFSQFYRKFDQQIVFEVWAEIMTNPGFDDYFNKWRWKPQMTIMEAADSLDCCCDSIEVMIQQRQEEKKKGN